MAGRGIIDKALRLGEGKKFKEYEKRVDSINRFEPELELLDDAEIRARADELRQRAREEDEPIDELLPEAVRDENPWALTRRVDGTLVAPRTDAP